MQQGPSIHSLLQSLKNGNSIAHIPVQMLPLAEAIGLRKVNLKQTIWETTAGYAYRASGKMTDPLKVMMRLVDDLDQSNALSRM